MWPLCGYKYNMSVYSTSISAISQCLQLEREGLLRLGASGSTIISVYFLWKRKTEKELKKKKQQHKLFIIFFTFQACVYFSGEKNKKQRKKNELFIFWPSIAQLVCTAGSLSPACLSSVVLYSTKLSCDVWTPALIMCSYLRSSLLWHFQCVSTTSICQRVYVIPPIQENYCRPIVCHKNELINQINCT